MKTKKKFKFDWEGGLKGLTGLTSTELQHARIELERLKLRKKFNRNFNVLLCLIAGLVAVIWILGISSFLLLLEILK